MDVHDTPDNLIDSSKEEVVESLATAPWAVERRLNRHMIIACVLFIILAGILGNTAFVLGVTGGCLLAYLNYRWLHRSLKAILAISAAGMVLPGSRWVMSKFLLRWIIILAGLVVAAEWGGVKVLVGMTVGLLSLVAAVMMEALAQVYWLIRKPN